GVEVRPRNDSMDPRGGRNGKVKLAWREGVVYGLLGASSPSQIQCQRVLWIVDRSGLRHVAGRVADREKAGAATGLGFVGVDRHAVVTAAAGMGDVIGAATQ